MRSKTPPTSQRVEGMVRLLPALAMALLLTMQPVSSADARDEGLCLVRPDMLDLLVTDHEEHLAEVHPTPAGLLEFHVSPFSGSWTAIVTDEDGVSCVLGFGEGIDPSNLPIIRTGFEI